MTNAPLVSLRNISKSFSNGVRVLDDYTLDIHTGETLTLLGPSGCGKSTVLRLIEGLIQPSAGEIIWRDANIKNNLGAVFQEPTLLPWANVFDNVYLPLRLVGTPRVKARQNVEEALANVGLSDFAFALPRELSGGMKMRCAIARALVTKPTIILLDEPFAALDEVTRFRLNDDLLQLKKLLSSTIIFVTHSVFESAFLSTRIIVMSKTGGRIIDEINIEPTIGRDENFRLSPLFQEISRRATMSLKRSLDQNINLTSSDPQ